MTVQCRDCPLLFISRSSSGSVLSPHLVLLPGQYMCFAENAHGVATSNSVFVRQSILNNFKENPPITKTVEEGKPFTLPCEAPDGWPKPSVYWMIQVRGIFRSVGQNHRMTQLGIEQLDTAYLLVKCFNSIYHEINAF